MAEALEEGAFLAEHLVLAAGLLVVIVDEEDAHVETGSSSTPRGTRRAASPLPPIAPAP